MIRGDFLLIQDAHRGESWMPHGQPDWAVHALAAVPLFEGVSRRHLRRVIKLIVVREYGDGVRVVRVGSRGEAFHIVLDGKALVALPGGDEVVLRPGDGFGELALIDGAPRSATVLASGDLTTGRIAGTDFRRLLREEPAIAVGLLPGLVRVVREIQRAHPPGGAGRSADRQKATTDATARKKSAAPGTAVPEGPGLLGWKLALRHVPMFAPLPERHLRRVAKLFAVKRYRDGAMLVREDDPGDNFCIVLDGRARVQARDGSTHELQAGESFGELALIDGAPRSATIVALGDVTLARIPRSGFQKLLRDEPQIGVGLVGSLVQLIRELQGQEKGIAGAQPS